MDPTPRILQFIESWLKKGFEDPELTCSSKIREFARSVTGSQTMEDKAREIASLVDDPDYVGQRERTLLRLLIRRFFYIDPPPQSRKLYALTTRTRSTPARDHTV